jgi:hypothetical protein
MPFLTDCSFFDEALVLKVVIFIKPFNEEIIFEPLK